MEFDGKFFEFATLEDYLGEEAESMKLEFTSEEKEASDYFWKCVDEGRPFDWFSSRHCELTPNHFMCEKFFHHWK